MYSRKRNPENRSQIDAREKTPSQKPQICPNTNFLLHFKGSLKKIIP